MPALTQFGIMQPTSTSAPPRSRASGRSGPRTRTGCLTCRYRKVRCDQSTAPVETRSRCGNCLRLELDCHYAPPGAQRKPPRRLNRPPDTLNPPGPSNAQDPTTLQSAGESAAPPSSSTAVTSPQPENNYLAQQDAADQMQLDRVFGDMSDLSAFSYSEWQPGFPFGIMSPVNGVFSSSLLPCKDISQGNDPAANSINPGVSQSQELRPAPALPDLSRRQSAPASSSSIPRLTSERPLKTPEGVDLALFDVTEHQRQLLLHFTPKTTPIPLITPTDSQWKSAYSSLISMACGCSYLINAICAVSELNLASCKRGSVSQAFTYYQSAAAKADAVLNLCSSRVDDRTLKQAFAALFLLMHAEVMAHPLVGSQGWPTTHLRSAYRHLKRHNDRLQLWTGIGSHILSWIQIVDSKAVYAAGMEKEADRTSSDLNIGTISSPTPSEMTSVHRASPSSPNPVHLSYDAPLLAEYPLDKSFSSFEEPLSAPEIAYDALYQPAYKFFMRCQCLIPRIIALDQHHRPRGPLDAELEVLQIGQRLRAELRELWHKRPQSLGVLDDTSGLHEVLHPRVARKIIQNFRGFVASFHAIRILLHRVAFINYPASDEVKHAIAEILRLAREQIADEGGKPQCSATQIPARGDSLDQGSGCNQERSSDNSAVPPENTAFYGGESINQPPAHSTQGPNKDTNKGIIETLPAAGGPSPIMLWLWPLFMCGTECTFDESRWVIDRIYAMESTNAERTAILLTEVIKQQNESNRRVDQRSIRQKIFADEFDVVY